MKQKRNKKILRKIAVFFLQARERKEMITKLFIKKR